MKNFKENNTAITLIALVITIIVLLILAGVAIAMLTGENGILKNATKAGEETIKAQIKEEIELAIQEIQIEELPKGNQVTLESLANGQLQNKLEGIIADKINNEIQGEYKDYEYTIDEKFKVEIANKITGTRISYTLNPKEYTNQNVILTVNATSTDSQITNIEAPSGLTKNADGTYTVTENGSYEFTITDDKGNTKTKTIVINNIDRIVPQDFTPTISDVTMTGFKIQANAVDHESGIARYEYYINEVKHETTEGSYTINSLDGGTNYTIYVIAYDKAGNSKKSEEVQQKTKIEEVDLTEYINSHVTVDKIIYISSINGNDTTGDGTKQKPYATLDKIAEEGIIETGYSYAIALNSGEYSLSEKIFELNCNQELNIFGNKKHTKLTVGTLYDNRGGGSRNYTINIYRLWWNSTHNQGNTIFLSTDMNLNNVLITTTFTSANFSLFITNGGEIQFNNCTLPMYVYSMLRATVLLTNCYGGFTSGWGTSDSQWNYQTNHITTTPQVDENYRITEADSVWKNVGTGTNPDGSRANLGLYGGEYSWER